MGLRNNRTTTARTRLVVPANVYMSIGESDLRLKKVSSGNYTLTFVNTMWKDESARNTDGVAHFESTSYTIAVVERGMAANMYTTAYNHLKTIYTSTTDV